MVMRRYSEDVKRKVRRMVKDGTYKTDVARVTDVPYRTVAKWTPPTWRNRKFHRKIRLQARKLVRMGFSKAEAARMIKVSYQNIMRWTKDIKIGGGNRRIVGFTLGFLEKLISTGFCFTNSQPQWSLQSYKTLKRHNFPIKRVTYHRHTVVYLEGSEIQAMKALLKKLNIRSINYGKLGRIRQAFGIKRYDREFNKRKVLE